MKRNKYGPDLNDPKTKGSFIKLLKPFITNPNIIVGDFTYYYPLNGEQGLKEFQNRNVLYHFPDIKDKCIIGKFCSIAHGTKFIMNGANHRTESISSYPFETLQNGWEGKGTMNFPYRGDTQIGNDVWIGYNATIMPGVKVGDGAIIGACSVVTKNVEPYTIVGGNPAKIIRKRFDDDLIEILLDLKWWDLPQEEITELIPLITSNDIKKLKDKIKK